MTSSAGSRQRPTTSLHARGSGCCICSATNRGSSASSPRGRARRPPAAWAALPARAVAATMAHTRVQFETTTEKAFAHVDAERLVALDGQRLDAGTPMNDAHTFDAEDVPVLFELARRRALPAAELPP